MDNNISLFAKKPDQITKTLGLEKTFQGRQIYQWLLKGVKSFSEMTNLPKALREQLEIKYPSLYSSKVIANDSDSDGSRKLALELFDKSIIECVLLTDKENSLTACVSSQVGCAMGCKFCRTGTLKLKRNLYDFEIIEQFMHLQNLASSKISHVVFMGMGEPLANIDNVLSAISFMHDESFIALSHRRITISTCGLANGINELTKRQVPVKLAVSLVTADDQKRCSLMPVNKAYPLKTLREALIRFQKTNNRRFTFEYCMIHDQNIGQNDAENLARFCRGLEVIVNLIPFNACPELPFESPSDAEIRRFTDYLKKKGVEYTIRVSRGRSIKGACGQLAGKIEDSKSL